MCECGQRLVSANTWNELFLLISKYLINLKELQLYFIAFQNVKYTVTDYILIFQCCVMFRALTAVLMDFQLFWHMIQCCQLVKVTHFWRNFCLHFLVFLDNLNLTAYKKGNYYFGIKVFNKLPCCVNVLSYNVKHLKQALKNYLYLNSFYI